MRMMVWLGMACLVALQARAAQPQPDLARVKSYHLTGAEIKVLSVEAMQGSGEAAARLCDNFFVDRYDANGVRTAAGALPWALVGAENGNVEAQFRVYQLLGASANRLDQFRALYWLRRAAAEDYPGARAVLKICPTIHSHPPHMPPCFGPNARTW